MRRFGGVPDALVGVHGLACLAVVATVECDEHCVFVAEVTHATGTVDARAVRPHGVADGGDEDEGGEGGDDDEHVSIL